MIGSIKEMTMINLCDFDKLLLDKKEINDCVKGQINYFNKLSPY